MKRYTGNLVIELEDQNTGNVETVSETNMVTNAVNDILGVNPMGVMYKAGGEYDDSLTWNNALLPICPNMIGGILLFPGSITEQANNIYLPSTNLPVAYASNDVNATANTKRGSMNLTESMKLTDGYKFIPIWEPPIFMRRRACEMKEFWNVIQAIFAAVGGWLGYFLGGNDGLLYALLAFVVLDYITGVMCAVADKKLSSAVGFKGICRKVLIFALVGIGHLLDTHIFGEAGVLRTAIIFFYISNEGLSLVENAAYLGLPIPGKLHKVLEQLHDRSEKEDDGKDGKDGKNGKDEKEGEE